VWFDQQAYPIRCEWGERGVETLAPAVDVLILVDVLSFSTCVDAATSRGAIVYPLAWKDERATEFARQVDGVLAGPRSATQFSLSPSSMAHAVAGQRIVLPSPNGAALSRLTGSTPTLTGCFRNSAAVARRALAFGPRVGVVPAGERWADGTLRPALEDWLGAGAILAHCVGNFSPEAQAARAAFDAARADLAAIVARCASGRELIEQGWERDVRLAVEVDSSTSAPLLRDGAYCAD
jgi:2-phosphosulfolactate phosphatase